MPKAASPFFNILRYASHDTISFMIYDCVYLYAFIENEEVNFRNIETKAPTA